MRCAIYTRKSSAEGLEQKFNSLDAQRGFCEAYVASQAAEGWIALPRRYDDGGYSGGNTERPGLRALLADIEAGRVDIVVVYKIDRLSRSLRDFVRLITGFEARNVTFTAVTQSFSTTSSVGRLTLNVLLSFAQFERELTSERLRDKFSASKERGLWLHGRRPYGYKLTDQRLEIEAAEARVIQRAARLCLRGWSLLRIARQFAKEGLLNREGRPIRTNNVHCMLSKRLYLGERKGHDGKVMHPPILGRRTWEAVQLARASRYTRRGPRPALQPPMLSGLLYDDEGRKMLHVYKTANDRRRCYYTNGDYKDGRWPTTRLRAGEMEGSVVAALDRFLATPACAVRSPAETETLLRSLVRRIDLRGDIAQVSLANGAMLYCAVEGRTPATLLAMRARHGLKRRRRRLEAR